MNNRPPAQQTGALPTELTRRRFTNVNGRVQDIAQATAGGKAVLQLRWRRHRKWIDFIEATLRRKSLSPYCYV